MDKGRCRQQIVEDTINLGKIELMVTCKLVQRANVCELRMKGGDSSKFLVNIASEQVEKRIISNSPASQKPIMKGRVFHINTTA